MLNQIENDNTILIVIAKYGLLSPEGIMLEGVLL